MTDYTDNLERIIKEMLRPLRNVPFNLVIEAISTKKILLFNSSLPENSELLMSLEKAADSAGRKINRNGIQSKRANEVGNAIEGFVKAALNELGLRAATPTASRGKKKATGYPDIEMTDLLGRTSYLECKTYNNENISTTQRSFYLSPSENFKVTKDAFHFLLAYEVFTQRSHGNMNIYGCKTFKIISLEDLLVDVKYEFNSDNRRLYSARVLIEKNL